MVEIRDDGTIMRTLPKIFRSILAFSLLSGLVLLCLFMPSPAQAGLLSSILGDEAHAQINATETSESTKNSQNLALLQANVSSASIIEERQEKKSSNKNKTMIIETNLNILSDNALVPSTGPLGVSNGAETPDPLLSDTSVYVVRKGDSVSKIAEMFGVSTNTILSANDMKKNDKLAEGDVLLILPVSGVKHTVTKNQTLKSIAKLYKVDVADITNFNGLEENEKLSIGDELMIPNGQTPESSKPIQNLRESIDKDKKYYESHPVQNLAGYFINPVPGYRKSQGIHDKNGVDFAIAKGTPIKAPASGRVTLARNGYNGGFGNLIIISHPNGVETLYAHMSKLGTTTGAQVAQGEVIGYVGSTGRSSGPHLHFEVHGARNPGADGSWAN